MGDYMGENGNHALMETIVIAVRDDQPGQDAVRWALEEFSVEENGLSRLFLLLHVVAEVLDASGDVIPVEDAEQHVVAAHVCDNVLPFLEGMQDLCDDYDATSSIEVVKSENRAEAILDAAERLVAKTLVLGATDRSFMRRGTVGLCTAPGAQPPGCAVVVISGGRKAREIMGGGRLPPQATPSGRLGSSVLGLVENMDFKSNSASGESRREKWQKRAAASGALRPAVTSDNNDYAPPLSSFPGGSPKRTVPHAPDLHALSAQDDAESAFDFNNAQRPMVDPGSARALRPAETPRVSPAPALAPVAAAAANVAAKPPTAGAASSSAGEGTEVSALQMARMAYRAVKNPAVEEAEAAAAAAAAAEPGSGSNKEEFSSGPVELALPPPSVTRSAKMSGKLSAKLASGKLGAAKGSRGAGGVPLDAKTREAKEVAASNSIRASMGKGPAPPLIIIKNNDFKVFSVVELQRAMDHFWPNHIAGEGSYGIVYRGMLDGQDVAIKQLKNPDPRQAMEEIDREIEVQKRCMHQNLVRLLGYSIEDRSLVYEYLSNGSLEDRLLCMGGSPPLLWPDRCRIAMEVAAGLQHLHTRTPPIVHRDVKPANVLLDEHFVAKVGDVGLARLMEDMANGNTHIVRKSVIVGTEHYVDPEYLCARRGYLGPKSDVYSFGIVLLQILVGGIPNLRKIDMAVEREELASLLDPKAGDWPIPLAMDLANLGLWCSEMDRKDRPDLGEEVIPALLEICEAAAMEVMASEARNEKAKGEELRKKEEAARILEEEKAAVEKAKQEAKEKEEKAAIAAAAAAAAGEAAAAATAAAAAAQALTTPPATQAMSKAAPLAPADTLNGPGPEKKAGCC
eukprot:TRINITY_DN539_c0_g5_i1.p1 TRINITY_DN539_c0_g5~~TRINITY_DN539_c0_g5_i1.p1  ORF type:complete len:852 (+),score=191.58 TRINITY_DN539_c0_g5_i1:451-3006(+)